MAMAAAPSHLRHRIPNLETRSARTVEHDGLHANRAAAAELPRLTRERTNVARHMSRLVRLVSVSSKHTGTEAGSPNGPASLANHICLPCFVFLVLPWSGPLAKCTVMAAFMITSQLAAFTSFSHPWPTRCLFLERACTYPDSPTWPTSPDWKCRVRV